MVLERERDIIKLFITETLGAFCKSHLAYSSQITIDGLVGVTIDHSNVILVTIKESIEPSDKAEDEYLDNVNTEILSTETSDSSFHYSNNNCNETDRSHLDEKVASKFIVPFQSPEVVPVKIEDSNHFEKRKIESCFVKEHSGDTSLGRQDFGLDLSLHARNTITIIEPEGTKDEDLPGTLDPGQDSEDVALDSGNVYPPPRDRADSRHFVENKSKHLLLPLFVSNHRTNSKRRKIQLLTNEHSERNFVADIEQSSALPRVKVERSSPGFDPRSVQADGDVDPVYQDSTDISGCNLSSGANNNILGSTTHSVTSSLSSNRWLGSSQLPWADFQNMLIKSWRRNHHEEMLLKPLAHALIESWTNLGDTSSHKRIGECVQAILLYEGRYVPVRDIQRLRLSSMTSQEIRSTMEFLNSTREGKVGCYREIRGGIGVFYKCPPHLVDIEFLESFGLTLTIYETRYNSRMVSNATNRHSAVYWYRIETCSPYLTSTEVL